MSSCSQERKQTSLYLEKIFNKNIVGLLQPKWEKPSYLQTRSTTAIYNNQSDSLFVKRELLKIPQVWYKTVMQIKYTSNKKE